jgi:hypothetical protein
VVAAVGEHLSGCSFSRLAKAVPASGNIPPAVFDASSRCNQCPMNREPAAVASFTQSDKCANGAKKTIHEPAASGCAVRILVAGLQLRERSVFNAFTNLLHEIQIEMHVVIGVQPV